MSILVRHRAGEQHRRQVVGRWQHDIETIDGIHAS
jgi:hypothetical protein